MAQAEAEWRAGLKTGDVVAVVFSDGHRMASVVTDASTTHFEACGEWWSRHDGIGEGRITRIAGTKILPPLAAETSKRRERYLADERSTTARESRRPDHLAAIRAFLDRDPGAVPIDVLERVVAAIPKGA